MREPTSGDQKEKSGLHDRRPLDIPNTEERSLLSARTSATSRMFDMQAQSRS